MSHAGQRIAPLGTKLIRDVFVAAGKRNRLESDGLHLVDILRGARDDLTNRIGYDAVDDRHNQGNLDTDLGQVFDRSNLYVKQISDTAVFVLLFPHTIELQVDAMLTCSFGRLTEFQVFGKANSISGRENAIKTNLLGVSYSVEVIR